MLAASPPDEPSALLGPGPQPVGSVGPRTAAVLAQKMVAAEEVEMQYT